MEEKTKLTDDTATDTESAAGTSLDPPPEEAASGDKPADDGTVAG